MKTKIKWFLGISMIFFLILATNLIDKDSFQRINNSVSTIYKDRIIAYDLLYNLNNCFNKKQIAYLSDQKLSGNSSIYKQNQQIDSLIQLYKATKLTPEETTAFKGFLKSYNTLQQLEQSKSLTDEQEQQWSALIGEIRLQFKTLTQIQLDESKKEVYTSSTVADKVNLFTRLEIYALIIMAIILQIIVMYSPKKE